MVWKSRRNKKRQRSHWVIGEISSIVPSRRAMCVPRSPFREVSGNVPIMVGRVPHIFPRLSTAKRSPLFSPLSRIMTPPRTMTEVENVLKTFATGPLPETVRYSAEFVTQDGHGERWNALWTLVGLKRRIGHRSWPICLGFLSTEWLQQWIFIPWQIFLLVSCIWLRVFFNALFIWVTFVRLYNDAFIPEVRT